MNDTPLEEHKPLQYIAALLLLQAIEAQLEFTLKMQAERDDAVKQRGSMKEGLDAIGRHSNIILAERDALRLAFAEASHNAGPAFVAHEELNRLKLKVERFQTALEQIAGMDPEEMRQRADGVAISALAPYLL